MQSTYMFFSEAMEYSLSLWCPKLDSYYLNLPFSFYTFGTVGTHVATEANMASSQFLLEWSHVPTSGHLSLRVLSVLQAAM